MVFVKVRETYDLHTTKDKMTVIGIHTPKPDIIKANYPGLLMQCRAYRPVSADVRVACASVLPLDPQGVGLSEGDVAPEDVFNPILYKAMSNKGMSQLEARINMMRTGMYTVDVDGKTAVVDVDSVTSTADEFPIYYGLLSETSSWKHANPQSGLAMNKLKPLVYEMVYNVGDTIGGAFEAQDQAFAGPADNGVLLTCPPQRILGKAKHMPFINCTAYSYTDAKTPGNYSPAGFSDSITPANCEINVPYLHVFVGCIIVPPSRLHEMFYRMVVEWTIEFTSIRPISEITNWGYLANQGTNTHYQNYSYEATKEVLTGDSDTILNGDSCMVSANVDVEKVM